MNIKALLFWIEFIVKIPLTKPLKNFFILIVIGLFKFLTKKLKIKKKIIVNDMTAKIVATENLFPFMKSKIKSYWRLKAIRTKQISIKRSIIRSVIIVPKVFSNGIFSYVLKVVALKTSPDRGTPKFAKYEIITAKARFIYLGL